MWLIAMKYIFLLISVIESVNCWTYFGCFTYNFDIEQSIGASGLQTTPLTSCSYQCGRLNKRYFILKTTDVSAPQDSPIYVYECYCSNNLPTSSSARCRFQCEGGSCGDLNAGSVYSSCNRGRWGWDNYNATGQCNKECHCADGDICRVHDGLCPGACADIYWGNSCDESCDCDSSGGPTCNKADGTCNCIPGRYGARCDLQCHCASDAACGQSDGQCPAQCEGGYWGESCTNSCACNSIGAPTCNKVDGRCNCITGRYSDLCDRQCHCAGGAACRQSDGHCPGECEGGYWGDRCSTPCDCESLVACQKQDGQCLYEECPSGRYGPQCDVNTPYESVGCFSLETIKTATSLEQLIDDQDNHLESCRNLCVDDKNGFFSIISASSKYNCHCIREISQSESNPCTNIQLAVTLSISDIFIEVYTTCPLGTYDSRGDGSCNIYCGCTGGDNWSGICTFDGTAVDCWTCSSGWKGNLCLVDVNECMTEVHTCGPMGKCQNLPGSYQCQCPHGYYPATDSKSCLDVDECIDGVHHCQHICINNDGSYSCSCQDGYILDDDGQCTDIDECELVTCPNVCTNIEGSYMCGCLDGYTLSTNDTQCLDKDECLNGDSDCEHICTNTEGSYSCSCEEGYNSNDDKQSCIEQLSGQIAERTTKIGLPQNTFILIGVIISIAVVAAIVVPLTIITIKKRRHSRDNNNPNSVNDDYLTMPPQNQQDDRCGEPNDITYASLTEENRFVQKQNNTYDALGIHTESDVSDIAHVYINQGNSSYNNMDETGEPGMSGILHTYINQQKPEGHKVYENIQKVEDEDTDGEYDYISPPDKKY